MNLGIASPIDIIILDSVSPPDTGFVTLGAKADGLYIRLTGEDAKRLLTVDDQFWQRASGVISPKSVNDTISTDGSMSALSQISAGAENEKVVSGSNFLNITGRDGLPKQILTRSGASGYLPAVTQVGNIDFAGQVTSGYNIGARITAKSGSQSFSTSNAGTELEVLTAIEGSITLVSRIFINSSGFITFNESGAAIDIRFEGDTDQNLLIIKGSSDRVGIGTTGSVNSKLHIVTKSTEGTPVLILENNDGDEPFIQLIGTESINTSTHISTTCGPSGGSVDGPRRSYGTADGFRPSYMAKVKLNNQQGWVCIYTIETPT